MTGNLSALEGEEGEEEENIVGDFFYFQFNDNKELNKHTHTHTKKKKEVNIGDMKTSSMRDMIALESTRRSIAKKFEKFLRGEVNEKGESIYAEKIKNMCQGKLFLFIFYF